MDAKQFLAEFGHIVNAPDGLLHIKNMINRMAICGDLSKRVEKDSSVEELLNKSKSARNAAIEKGKCKAVRGARNISQVEKQFNIPAHWRWTTLEMLAFPQAGFAFKSNNFNEAKIGLPLIRIRDVGSDTFQTYFSGEYREEFEVYKGDYLISMDGEFRVSSWKGPTALLNQRVTRLIFHGYCTERFVVIALQSYLISLQGTKSYTTVDHLSGKQIAEAPIPLPPIEEQERIVAKVDELMALCDKFEAQQQKRHKLQTLTRTTALGALANAQSLHELKDAWERINNNMTRLFSESDDVGDLRKGLIGLAVLGFYTKPKSYEETASELLDKIREEKRKLVKDKLIRKPTPLSKIEADDEFLELPVGWEWVRLGDVAKVITSGSRGWAKYYSDKGAIFIGMGNLSKGNYKLRMSKVQHVNPPNDSEGARTQLEEGDLLISITGDVGMLGLIPEDFGEAYINQHTCLVRLMDGIEKRFIAELMRSPLCIQQFNEPQRGIKNSFRLSDVAEMLIPLPPLEEQRNLLNIIDGQMSLCDRMESQLRNITKVASNLASAAVATITGTEVNEEEQMKIRTTELVSTLKLKVSPTNKDQAPLSAILAKHNGELSSKALWNYSGLEIDAFYRQLKTEMARDWIVEPQKARVIEKDAEKQNEAEAG